MLILRPYSLVNSKIDRRIYNRNRNISLTLMYVRFWRTDPNLGLHHHQRQNNDDTCERNQETPKNPTSLHSVAPRERERERAVNEEGDSYKTMEGSMVFRVVVVVDDDDDDDGPCFGRIRLCCCCCCRGAIRSSRSVLARGNKNHHHYQSFLSLVSTIDSLYVRVQYSLLGDQKTNDQYESK